jgi:pilus assembly protein CpaD
MLSDEQALVLDTPAQRHAIGFRSGRAQLDVEVPPGEDSFSPNQQSDVLSFFTRYQAEATGPLYVALPAGARGNTAALQLREMAQEAGVAPTSVRVSRGGARDGFARLAYNRREVEPPVCGDWSEDLGRNHERVHYPNFGCATQRNLALMVANPRDLQKPAPEDTRSAEKRSIDWSKYVGVPQGAPGSQAADTPSQKPAGSKGGAPGAGAGRQ